MEEPDARGLREEIARVVDPEAWRRNDEEELGYSSSWLDETLAIADRVIRHLEASDLMCTCGDKL